MMLNVLRITSEVLPFIMSGYLAGQVQQIPDVLVRSLSRQMEENDLDR
jgi:hypothetical protein